MNTIKVVGTDLVKSVFQVYGWMGDGMIASNQKISCSKLLDTVRQFPVDTLIAMKTCATAHYWGRTFHALGDGSG